MNRDEALSALGEVDQAQRRTQGLGIAAGAGSGLVIWGLVWLVCNVASQVSPLWGPTVWGPGVLIGSLASFLIGRRSGQGKDRRMWGGLAIYVGLDAALIVALRLADPRQQNLVACLLVSAAYLLVGVWKSWRIGAIGLALAALTLVGWYALQPWFFLWMGVVGGGALIVTGLWLRRL